MKTNRRIFKSIQALSDELPRLKARIGAGSPSKPKGIAGFDGFIDTFIRLEQPSTMAPDRARRSRHTSLRRVQQRLLRPHGRIPLIRADLLTDRALAIGRSI